MLWSIFYRQNIDSEWIAIAVFSSNQNALIFAEQANIWEPNTYKVLVKTVTL